MLEGSQIPAQFGAEQRLNQIMDRLDSLGNQGRANSRVQSGNQDLNTHQDAKSFKAMVSMMQAQMMMEGFDNNKDDDDDNPMSGFMDSMMMQNPALAGSMQQNPMMAGMMNQGMGNNPMLAAFLNTNPMNSMNPKMMAMFANNPNMLSQANPDAQNFLKGINTKGMVMPVQGQISSDYGERMHPIAGHEHFHSGVDIAAQKGTAIRSPWSGTVVHVGYVQGFGDNTVVIAHENQKQEDGKIIYSVFGHNDKAFVQKGQEVESGEIFATVGSEGNSTGPHLHWETRVALPGVDGTNIFKDQLSYTVDPMSFTVT